MTPAQARDGLIEALPLDRRTLQEVRALSLLCEDGRKADPETYRQCPRCRGSHSVRGNFDDLCDRCCATILEHFPDHESAPRIREALRRWTEPKPTTKKETNEG